MMKGIVLFSCSRRFADLLSGFFDAASAVQYEIILFSHAPRYTCDIAVILRTRFVCAPDVPFGFLTGIAVDLHDTLNTGFQRRMNEHAQYIRMLTQNIIRCPPDYDAAAVFGNPFNDLFLRNYCLLHNNVA